MSVFSYFLKGGLMMWPILFASVVAVAVFIERFIFYKKVGSGRKFTNALGRLLAEGKTDEAAALAEKSSGDAAALISSAKDKSGENLRAYLEMEAGIMMAEYRHRLNYLSTIVTLAPLLGLLGTIGGMISAFNIFNLKAGEPMAITGGIGEALIATAAGLCVAIIALILHAYLTNKMDGLITELEQCGSALIEAKARGDE